MAYLSTVGDRRTIMCATDIGIDQPLCDQTGTPVGYPISDMFDPHIAGAQHRLENKARAIAKAASRFEPSSYPMPRIRDYREQDAEN